MFTIYGGKTEFNQWEQGQRVTNPKMVVGDKAVFRNATGETHPMLAYEHEGVVVADVPNDLLMYALPILVDLCENNECRTSFQVIAQDKPEDYVFVDNTHCEPAAPSGGGVSSWNDLTDKPFGEEVTEAMQIIIPTSTDGLVVVSDMFVRVTEKVPAADALLAATMTLGDQMLPVSMLGSPNVQDGVTGIGYFFLVTEKGASITTDDFGELVFPETGFYALSAWGGAVIDIPSVTAITRIPSKYMPYEVAKTVGSFVSIAGSLAFTKSDEGAWVADCDFGDEFTNVMATLQGNERPCFLSFVTTGDGEYLSYVLPAEVSGGSKIIVQIATANQLSGVVTRNHLFIDATWNKICTDSENIMEILTNYEFTFTVYCV